MMSLSIDLEITLSVNYSYVEKPSEGRYYPIDIKSVHWRGEDIYNLLDVTDVLTLQRRVLNRLQALADKET